MTPNPPDLDERSPDWNDREVFWIVDHGLKLAGMSAFGATESRETLWSIVGFLRQLPGMSAAQYAEWRSAYGSETGREVEGLHADAGAPAP